MDFIERDLVNSPQKKIEKSKECKQLEISEKRKITSVETLKDQVNLLWGSIFCLYNWKSGLLKGRNFFWFRFHSTTLEEHQLI